eukprot:1932451-Rhodomonas_salina.1
MPPGHHGAAIQQEERRLERRLHRPPGTLSLVNLGTLKVPFSRTCCQSLACSGPHTVSSPIDPLDPRPIRAELAGWTVLCAGWGASIALQHRF